MELAYATQIGKMTIAAKVRLSARVDLQACAVIRVAKIFFPASADWNATCLSIAAGTGGVMA